MKAKLKHCFLLVFVMALTSVMVSEAVAQPDQNHRRERLETVIIGKFATELDLTPEQAERFFPLFRQLRNETEAIQRRQHDTRVELDNLSRSAPPATPPVQRSGRKAGAKSPQKSSPMKSNLYSGAEKTKPPQRPVADVISERQQIEQEAIRLRTKFLHDIGEFLTPQQVSRCSILPRGTASKNTADDSGRETTPENESEASYPIQIISK